MPNIEKTVKAFYDHLPFNYDESPMAQAESIREGNQLEVYKPLVWALSADPDLRVLDVGCGTGWFSNSAAYWYGVAGTAVDFTHRAVRRARETGTILGVENRIRHICADLYTLPRLLGTGRYGIVAAVGVLHHTKDCREALKAVSSVVSDGGHILLGLYHRPGREALLEMFRPIRQRLAEAVLDEEREAIEMEGFNLWQGLRGRPGGETFERSWYRDQCLHPHETQWNLKEVCGWLEEAGVEPLSTSLDRFAESPDWERLFEHEEKEREVGYTKVFGDGSFHPGFFVVWGKKTARDGRSRGMEAGSGS